MNEPTLEQMKADVMLDQARGLRNCAPHSNIRNITTKELLERRKQRRLFQGEHFLRHAISGFIVFSISVAADVLVTRYLSPVATQSARVVESINFVRWQDGTYSTNFTTISAKLPEQGAKVHVGFSSDGRVFWRPAP